MEVDEPDEICGGLKPGIGRIDSGRRRTGSNCSPHGNHAANLAPVVLQLGQLGRYAQTAGYATQGIGAAGSGATPAQPTTASSQTTPDGQTQMADDTKKNEEEEQQPEILAEGAVAGVQTSEGAPIKPTTPGRPGTTPSETEL